MTLNPEMTPKPVNYLKKFMRYFVFSSYILIIFVGLVLNSLEIIDDEMLVKVMFVLVISGGIFQINSSLDLSSKFNEIKDQFNKVKDQSDVIKDHVESRCVVGDMKKILESKGLGNFAVYQDKEISKEAIELCRNIQGNMYWVNIPLGRIIMRKYFNMCLLKAIENEKCEEIILVFKEQDWQSDSFKDQWKQLLLYDEFKDELSSGRIKVYSSEEYDKLYSCYKLVQVDSENYQIRFFVNEPPFSEGALTETMAFQTITKEQDLGHKLHMLVEKIIDGAQRIENPLLE